MKINAIRLMSLWMLLRTVEGIGIVPEGYERHMAPRKPGDRPVNVAISMKVNGISEVNLEEMSLRFELYFRVSWQDPRLNFPGKEDGKAPPPSSALPRPSSTTPPESIPPPQPGLSHSSPTPSPASYFSSDFSPFSSDIDGITTSNAIMEKVWTPDVFIEGTRAIDTFSLFQKFQGVVLYQDSNILTSIMMQLKLGCTMAFHTYPFDIQNCKILISSYMYSKYEVSFSWMAPGLTADEGVNLQLASYDYSITPLNETQCYCHTCVPRYSPCLLVLLVLRRHSFIHVIGEYVPSSLFVLVGWSSFFWPADVVPGRTVLVVTALLTITTMYSDIRQTSPTTSYVKAIDVWLFMCILLTTLPLLQYAVVLTWRKKQGASKVQRVSPMSKIQTKDSNTSEIYVLYERRTEWAGRIGVPLCFFIFNLVYWPTYLRD